LLAVGLGVLLTCGCRSKHPIDASHRSVPPPGEGLGGGGLAAGGAGGDFKEISPVAGTAQDWTDMSKKMAGRRGGNIERVHDAKWDGVVVYFAFDSAAVGPSERPKIEALAKHLADHPDYAVVVEGNCDERGSDEYNRSLGESRALAVRDYLVQLGVQTERLETVSYGKERPVVPHASTETEHQKNRRAEFVIGIRK